MEAHTRWDISRVEVVPDRRTGCECGASIARSDTGKCERCTAKLPAQQHAWASWRTKCLAPPPPPTFSSPLPPDTCQFCNETYDGSLRDHQAFHCSRKKHACPQCGRRYSEHWDMTRHQRDSHGIAAL